MKHKFLFFLFILIFLFNLSYVSAVVKIQDLPNVSVLGTNSYSIHIHDYFSGFTGVQINFNDDDFHNYWVDCDGDSLAGYYCTQTGTTVCILPSVSCDMVLTFQGQNREFTNLIFGVLVYNTTNGTVLSYNSSTFLFSTTVVNNINSDFIGSLTNGFISIFPDSSTLTLTTKFGYVFITIFLFFLLYYGVIFFLIKGDVSKLSSFFHYIFFIIVIILCFFFIATSYIPLGVLIVFILIIVVLAYFRFKSGFSAQR